MIAGRTSIVFYHRLLSAVAVGGGLLFSAYAVHLAVWRVPALADIFADFGTQLPPLTSHLCRLPWLALVPPLAATGCGIIAFASARRLALIGAWVLLLLSGGTVLLAEIGLQAPLHALIRSVSGG